MTIRRAVPLTFAVAAISFALLQSPGAMAGESYTTRSSATSATVRTTGSPSSVGVTGGNTSSAPAPLDCSIESHPDCPRPSTGGSVNFTIQLGTSDMQNAE